MRTIFLLMLFWSCGIAHGEPFPWELLKDQQFSKLYRSAMEKRLQTMWLAKLSGPSSPATHITVEGNDFLFIYSCKPHNCDTDNLVMLYSAKLTSLYVQLVESNSVTMLGKPSPAVERELHRLYSQQFQASSIHGNP